MDNQSSTPKNPKFDFKSADIGTKTAAAPAFGTVMPDRPGFGARLKAFFSRIGAFFHKIGVKLKVYIFRPLFSGWRKFVTLGILALLITGTALGILFLSRQGINDKPSNLSEEQQIEELKAAATKVYDGGGVGYIEKTNVIFENAIRKAEQQNLHSRAVNLRWEAGIFWSSREKDDEAYKFLSGAKTDKIPSYEQYNFYSMMEYFCSQTGRKAIAEEYAKKAAAIPENKRDDPSLKTKSK